MSSSKEVIDKIELSVLNFLQQLVEKNIPSFEVPIRTTSNIVFDEQMGLIRLGPMKKTVSMSKGNGLSYTKIWKILETSYIFLHENKTATQREIYYIYPTYFDNQTSCNETIQDCVCLLNVNRCSLGIMSSPRGYISGKLDIYTKSNRVIYCDKVPPISISWELFQATAAIKTTALFILVIEKDGIFKRLYEDRIYDQLPCIIITGRGFPDISTRVYLHFIHTCFPTLPIYGLCDWNPYGLSLLLTYRCGSVHMGAEAFKYVVPIRWLGLHYNDIIRINIPNSAKKEFSKEDRSKVKSLLQHQFIKSNSNFYNELMKMSENEFKVELEAVHCRGLSFMCDAFIKDKIINHYYYE